MSDEGIRRWVAPGPVALALMNSSAFVQSIMGPIGSGKTSAALMKSFKVGMAQRPSPLDGVRKVRFTAVRETYRDLWRTTIPSWNHWVPRAIGEWSGSEGGPCSHVITAQHPNGGAIRVWWDFLAIGDNAVEDVLRGIETTAFYLNEADRLHPDVLAYCKGRVGRYPAANDGGPTWSGVILDYNAPDIENYLYKLNEEDRPEGHEFFRQPSGLSPAAENRANLPADYYERQMLGQPDWYIRRMIRNEYGYSRDGQPVYPEFNDTLHVSPARIMPNPAFDLHVGLDAGLTPAASFRQRRPNGQQLTVDELVTEDGAKMGPTRFAEALNARLASEPYRAFDARQIVITADPAAFMGGEGDDVAWAQIVANKIGHEIRPAPSNALAPRHDAVRIPMTTLIDGHDPGWLVSRHCTTLIKGYAAMYRYRRIMTAGATTYSDVIDKNHFSHVADADQYAAMICGDFDSVMGRQAGRHQARGQSHARTDDNPGGRFRDGRPGGRRQTHART